MTRMVIVYVAIFLLLPLAIYLAWALRSVQQGIRRKRDIGEADNPKPPVGPSPARPGTRPDDA